ncbi:hypothetical protein [Ochrobactrum sp. AN78]|uniref:hypothetical protein n=1 Tax=Ochrobactrum sp. AN78 TaxID=3039853 RepID=UPI002989B1D3|nr:hypothetical protein [Ochrobactrum sp. AN78]MDH7789145.1 hypothetical protein [Ochrobactrum sp. AN78]
MSEPSLKRLTSGIEAEYFVLSQLYRLGFDAHITLGSRKSIDIAVILSDGTAISIDVKSVRGYSSFPVDNVLQKSGHFLVFVPYDNRKDDTAFFPKTFIVPSVDLIHIQKDFNGKRRVLRRKLNGGGYLNAWHLLGEI